VNDSWVQTPIAAGSDQWSLQVTVLFDETVTKENDSGVRVTIWKK
jgi:hypothetical protein